ncbi:hypothetical protein [Janibacter terrae]|uniref:hypothetical protein n=1 Tax=Janibacter terrae TaxID=103817 RepID=UPI0008378B5B|nr:hypothetical protein [Janibacter terrae]
MPDLTALTDDDLDTLRRDVLTEQERRARVTAAPEQLADLTRSAVESGADPDTLRAAVEDALT